VPLVPGQRSEFNGYLSIDVHGDESRFMSNPSIQYLKDEWTSSVEEAQAQDNLQPLSEDEPFGEAGFDGIVGRSNALLTVLREIRTVAPTRSTVLIYGETGTGKELIARAIHKHSPRRTNAFVKLNCAAIPTGLLESELFGHERGAFTGAITQRAGRFEIANHGTAFLDEIGEIPLELQPKLLRVLQEREFERLGSTRTLYTDARLIAATHRNLGAMVEKQKFRSDLFYRLNVFPVRVPPLRERREDIPLLVWHFATHFAGRMKRSYESVSPETMRALCEYDWPGNIRELQNLIERAVILSPGPVLRVPIRELRRRTMTVAHKGQHQTLKEVERAHILHTLKETKWVLGGPNGAAARLAINRSTLQFRMKKLGIVRPGREDDAGSASQPLAGIEWPQ
jgi:formate hydrogenlyase transcriptional activator